MSLHRRSLLGSLAAVATTGLAAPTLLRAQAAPRILIIGGGFGGAALARHLLRMDPGLAVTLVDASPIFATCPFSNGVIGGLWPMSRIEFTRDGLTRAGIEVIIAEATALDPVTKTVTLADGRSLSADVVAVAPGISFDWAAIPGLTEETAQVMPHAWKAGPQTQLLRDQLVAMPDGGTFVMSIPRPPFRCPPGPYERISLIAHYFKQAKPAAKILVLDAQDSFSKQPLFEEAWAHLYPGMIERVPGAMSGAVIEVDATTMRVSTDFDDVTADVANVIPPQKAGRIALDAGLDDGLGWCPVDPYSFESPLFPGIHILGDAAIAGEMPKSAFSAEQQAATCAAAMVATLRGEAVQPARMMNTCYSLAAPDHGFSIADVFTQTPEGIVSMMQIPKITAPGAGTEVWAREAEYAVSWYDTITSQIFG